MCHGRRGINNAWPAPGKKVLKLQKNFSRRLRFRVCGEHIDLSVLPLDKNQ
jgi:hypothetical protein